MDVELILTLQTHVSYFEFLMCYFLQVLVDHFYLLQMCQLHTDFVKVIVWDVIITCIQRRFICLISCFKLVYVFVQFIVVFYSMCDFVSD